MSASEIRELLDYAEQLERDARLRAGVGRLNRVDHLQVSELIEPERIARLIRKACDETGRRYLVQT
jgi:hypothetical protein